MKFKGLLSTLFTISFLFLNSSYAANEFLNNNQTCQQMALLDSSASVACKNYNSSLNNIVSFSGGNYPDCAISNHFDSAGTDNVSVLLNKGANAVSCNPGPADQFDSAANYDFTGIDSSSIVGSIVVGLLNNDVYSDLAVASNDNSLVASAFSLGATGTFNPTTTDVTWSLTGGTISASNAIDRSIALLDCNNDNNLDAAVAILHGFQWEFNVLLNNGAGLQNASLGPYGVTTAIVTPLRSPSIAIADFNGDTLPDVAMSIGDNSSQVNKIVICLNTKDNATGNGTCDFTNCITTNVATDYFPLPNATSIAAGDFDGDGNADVAITAPGYPATAGADSSIIYYFGNGTGALTATQFQTLSTGNGIPKVLTTGCFNGDNILDLAVSVDGEAEDSGVNIFELNTSRVATRVPLTFSNNTVNVAGIDAADFDRGGRDDIIVVASPESGGNRQAYVFMNALGAGLSTAVATISSQNVVVQTNTPIQLSGQCSMTDGSVSDFNVQWTVTSANSANATLINSTTLNPTFTATESGNYTVQLVCTAACGSVGSATTIVVGIPAFDQGGCVSNHLTPLSTPINFSSLLPLLGSFGIWVMKKKKDKKRNHKKKFLLFVVFIFSLIFSPFSQASNSFQTNFFKPTIDDSEYFTVYSSPLMKKSYFHTGFYLDYAHHPYEFGDSGFNRTNSITNHLLTGNFVGSYAIFDWLNAGGRLPVYFWNGIHAPLLNRSNENHLELGDFAIELKFKLIDRKEHAVGWSLIPFMTIPTATHAVRDFTGNGSLTGGVKTTIDGKPHDRVSIALNVGYEARRGVITPGGSFINDHFLLGAGISGDAIKDKLKVIAETQVETVTQDFFSKRRTTPAEGRLGFRYMFKNGIDLNAGGGLGYTNGIASPDFRAFAGVTYTKRPIAKVAIKEEVGEVAIGEELKLNDKIYFEFDKAVIRNISKPTLDKAAAFIKAHPEIKKLRVEGHTCDLGTVPYNQKLSERRANSVVNYLVEQGISSSILHPVGYGELKPAVPNSDESHREQNRRVQFFVEEK